MKTHEYSKKAYRQLDKLPAADALAIMKAARTLRDWPACRNVKALSDRDGYRLRVGDYRVIFMVEDDRIIVTEVKRRNERTY